MRARLTLLLCALPALGWAGYDAGRLAYDRGDYRRALAELVPEADRDGRAALLLADMFAQGRGVDRDAQQALLWRRQAADLGEVQAQLDLGERYLHGRGVPAQPREAAVWFQRAAAQGSAQARYELGRMLVDGQGVPPDPGQGRQLIELAAAEGSLAAREWLGQATARDANPPAVAKAPRPATAPQRHDRNPATPEQIMVGPQVGFGWGTYQGWGNGTWSGFQWSEGPYGWGPGPGSWYPWGWYPYGYPGPSSRFGFGLAN